MPQKMTNYERLEELEFYFTDLLDSIKVIKKSLKNDDNNAIKNYASNAYQKINKIYKILYSENTLKHGVILQNIILFILCKTLIIEPNIIHSV